MLFNSNEFIFFFLPITIAVFFILGSRFDRRIVMSWLVLSSLFFYGWWNPAYLWLLIFSIVFNYSFGLLLSRSTKSKLLLTFGVGVNLSLLAYFKYTNFLIDNINVVFYTDYNFSHIILPLAVSFFTFQQVAYLVDAYRGEVRESNFLNYSLFVSFFPQLIAGPIVHHKEMLPQFARDSTYRWDVSNFNIGLAIFTLGLFKKVVLADGVSNYSTPVFNAADAGEVITFFQAWSGALAYTLQLYFDFSGYTDMAIGIAKMFGISLPINFNSPYKAINIIEFWRRWHITLSRFLKNYLYIPLGGNRKGSKTFNLFITMLLGGLWHGAAWNFVIWGALHGLYLIINHNWRLFRGKVLTHDLNSETYVGKFISIMITFLVVTVAWVFFRAESFSGAINMISGMLTLGGLGSIGNDHRYFWITGLLMIVFFGPNTQQLASHMTKIVKNQNADKKFFSNNISFYLPVIIGVIIFVSLKTLQSVSDSEFLYFNF